ncbi:hypothetical protein [Thioalkalivibrio thiocyanodenitrificans]|uniref:hypothetical protein n=1 Tax=Thioalkalivibrio thiocyanodenitrificans TaxID=243063 RepID=UPI0003604379|nr:hypothetical protein [Thioalkalivibrio thiocyanodenitrificans]
MSNHMADVTIHIDEETDHATREHIQDALRDLPGVMAASNQHERPHLMVVQYDPEQVNSRTLLDSVTASGVHAELIGL